MNSDKKTFHEIVDEIYNEGKQKKKKKKKDKILTTHDSFRTK